MKNVLTPELLADVATRYIDLRMAEWRDAAAVALAGTRAEQREAEVRAAVSCANMRTYWRTLEMFLSPQDLVLLAKEIGRRDREINLAVQEVAK